MRAYGQPRSHDPRIDDLHRPGRMTYDTYERYRPGERFCDRLAPWLDQFTPADRDRLLGLLAERLVFIDRGGMAQLVRLAWLDHIRPWLQRGSLRRLGLPTWHTASRTAAAAIRSDRRQTLVLGLSDGARLEQLRRSAPQLATHQFHPTPAVTPVIKDLRHRLRAALAAGGLPGADRFAHVVLVDDFSGTGATLLDRDARGAVSGRLVGAHHELAGLVAGGHLDRDHRVLVLLYLASADALARLQERLPHLDPGWEVDVVQPLDERAAAPTDHAFVEMCARLVGQAPEADVALKGSRNLDYRGGRLMVVLHHNTPNDSLAMLWSPPLTAHVHGEAIALFPRYERLHTERP